MVQRPDPLETGSRPRVARALSGLRAQVIHGDMSLDNVLFSDDLQVSGIVDFGDMTQPPATLVQHARWLAG